MLPMNIITKSIFLISVLYLLLSYFLLRTQEFIFSTHIETHISKDKQHPSLPTRLSFMHNIKIENNHHHHHHQALSPMRHAKIRDTYVIALKYLSTFVFSYSEQAKLNEKVLQRMRVCFVNTKYRYFD
jgi:hypothetical protein